MDKLYDNSHLIFDYIHLSLKFPPLPILILYSIRLNDFMMFHLKKITENCSFITKYFFNYFVRCYCLNFHHYFVIFINFYN